MKCIQGFAQVCSPCGNYGTIWFASAAAPGILLALNKCTTLITERGIHIFQKDLIPAIQMNSSAIILNKYYLLYQ